ncbi:MAG: hypothetical protein QME32_08550, partial [Endomicrobiia bacterium]|nr:hypothetical protein [Endomicrobiia bacterium]
MFIRRIKAKNSICFQVGEKRYGKFKLIKHIGCSTSLPKVEILKLKAQEILKEIQFKNQVELFPEKIRRPLKAKLLSWHITGYNRSFGKVYESIGFPVSSTSILKNLVIARIVYPKSKAATIRYLSRELGIDYD